MIATNVLKGLIVEKGLSQAKIAVKMGITPKTFYLKMAKGIFNSDEIEKLLEILDVKEPHTLVNIFFKDFGTQ